MTELQHKQLLVAQIFCSLPIGHIASNVKKAIYIYDEIVRETKTTQREPCNFNVGLEGITEHNDY